MIFKGRKGHEKYIERGISIEKVFKSYAENLQEVALKIQSNSIVPITVEQSIEQAKELINLVKKSSTKDLESLLQ